MKTFHVLLCALILASAACASRFGKPAGMSNDAGVPVKIPVIRSLAGTSWTVVELAGGNAVNATNDWPAPSLEFDRNGQTATGHGGVNRFGGRYSESGASLSFGPLALTRRIGPEAQMQIEAAYTLALSRVEGWRQQGAQLILTGPGAERLAVLERSPVAIAK